MSTADDSSSWSGFAALTLIGGLLTGFLLLLALWVGTSYNDAMQRTSDRVDSGAKIVATNAVWIDALARQALRRMDDAMGPDFQTVPGQSTADLARAVSGMPGNVNAYIVDASGKTLYTTDPLIRLVDITDREYFRHPAAGKEFFVSSLMVSRLSGEQIFAFSKRISRRGFFKGVAVIAFNVTELKEIWEAVDLGPKSTISLIRRDGMLAGRYPPSSGTLDMSNYILFTDYLRRSTSGSYDTISPLDGVSRIVGYRVVPGTEFVAIAAMDRSEQMAGFWRNTIVTLSFTVPVALGFAIAAFWVYRLMQLDLRRQKVVENALRQNKLLLGEIHHRVKNNLQAVQSLIRLRNIPADARLALSSRLTAMATVHEHIYKNDRFSEIPVRELLPSVVGLLVQAYSAKVDVRYQLDDIFVGDEQATPLALLVNEIVTNSLKYAFAGVDRGVLEISMSFVDSGEVRLSISDNGPGFDPATVSKGMGSRLIEGVVSQLQGRYHFDTDGGARFIALLAPDNMKLGPAG